jgi:hypothetical protein
MDLGSSQPDEDAGRGKLDDIFGFSGNGTLHFAVSEDTDWKSAISLNSGIGDRDFDAIYASALRSIGLEPVDTSGQYDWEKFETNQKRFASEFPQYPMMVSYQDMYKDYIHGPAEISALLKECRALQQIELSYEADLALRKLMYGCEEAAKKGT